MRQVKGLKLIEEAGRDSSSNCFWSALMESVPKSVKSCFTSQLNMVASKSNGVLVQKGGEEIKQ